MSNFQKRTKRASEEIEFDAANKTCIIPSDANFEFMQSEEQYLQSQFESMPVELQRQLIAVAKEYQQNAGEYRKAIKPENFQVEDKSLALTKGAVCLYVLIELDEVKPTETQISNRILANNIDKLYNTVKKHR